MSKIRRASPYRFSRAVPYALTEHQQRNFLTALANDEIRKDLETVMGKQLSTMTIQEQLEAFREYVDSGFGLAIATQVAKARLELREVASELRDELSREDRIRLLEAELDTEKQRRIRAENTLDLLDDTALANMTRSTRRGA